MEIWKDIPSLYGHYEASSEGRVRRKTKARGVVLGKCLTPQKNKSNGRYYIMVTINYKFQCLLLARVICETFHGAPPFDGAEADHIDEDKTNNRADNLQWLSRADNFKKSREAGNFRYNGPAISISQKKRHAERPESCPRGEGHARSKYTNDDIYNILEYRKCNPMMPITQLSKNLNLPYNLCWRVIKGTAWKHLNLSSPISSGNISKGSEDLVLTSGDAPSFSHNL